MAFLKESLSLELNFPCTKGCPSIGFNIRSGLSACILSNPNRHIGQAASKTVALVFLMENVKKDPDALEKIGKMNVQYISMLENLLLNKWYFSKSSFSMNFKTPASKMKS